MDKVQIAHDLAVAKLFSELLNSYDENYFLNELDKKKVNNCSSIKRPF